MPRSAASRGATGVGVVRNRAARRLKCDVIHQRSALTINGVLTRACARTRRVDGSPPGADVRGVGVGGDSLWNVVVVIQYFPGKFWLLSISLATVSLVCVFNDFMGLIVTISGYLFFLQCHT